MPPEPEIELESEREGVEAVQLLQSIILAIGEVPSLEMALQIVLQRVCEQMTWQLGEAWLPSPDQTMLTCSCIWHSESPAALQSFRNISEKMTFSPGVGLPGRVWATQQPEWVADVSLEAEMAFLRADAAIAAGLGAALGVPVLRNNRLLAVLVFFTQAPCVEDPQIVERVQEITRQLSTVIHLKQTERALWENQQQLIHLIDSLPGIVFMAAPDAEWSMIYLSEGCFKLTGYRGEELVGQERLVSYNDLTHPDDLPAVMEAVEQAIAQKCPYVVEYRIHTKGGEEKWLWEKGYGVYDSDGAVQRVEGFITDITDRKRAEEALRQTEQKYRSFVENAVEGIFQTTPEGRYLTVNPMLARIYGYSSTQALMACLTDIQQQLYVDSSRREEFIRLIQEQGAIRGFESQVYRQDGSIIWISESARACYSVTGELVGYEGTVEDITHRKQVEEELHKRDALLEGVAMATNCLLTYPDFRVAIPEVLEILGNTSAADRVYLYENQVHPETGDVTMTLRFEWAREGVKSGLQQSYWQNLPYRSFGLMRWHEAFCQGRAISGIVREFPTAERELLNRDHILAILMVPVFVDEQLWGYVGFDACQVERQWSVSEESILVAVAASIGVAIKRQRTEEQMRHQAFHDALTGLPNRVLFNDRLPQAIAHAHRTGELLAVLFLDLDRFKTINDTLGHAVGDRLLQLATTRLVGCLREGDTIARWGGDEFTLLLPNLKSAEDAAKVAQRIRDALKPSFSLDRHELHITCSLGIALYPYNGQDAQTLLKHADAALYRVKAQGRNNYQFYNAAISSQASERLTLDSHLHQALERNEFVVHYQPQINMLTGEVTQMEALLRWQHPQLGLVSPKTFISLAEENGTIGAIGEWVLHVACQHNKAWQMANLPPIRVAVNLSARQFQQPNLVKQVAQALEATNLEPNFLELEITETAAMQDVDFTTTILHDLRSMGVRIAIDDFGTGYSSLSYLKTFPLNALKIDQSFVRDLIDQSGNVAIITAIIALAEGLNLNVVAEGVETAAQMERLQSLNCHEMQGNWLSPALEVEVATGFLRQYRQDAILQSLRSLNGKRLQPVYPAAPAED